MSEPKIGAVTKSAATTALANFLAPDGPLRQLWNSSIPPPRLSLKDSSHVTIHEPSRSVGGGNFCDLFFGVHRPSNLVLAMKRPRFAAHDTTAAEKARRNFFREERAWNSLQHPNILPFCGNVKVEDEMYLVSPWIIYGDLWGFLSARLEYLGLSPGERREHPSHDIYARYREFDIVLGTASGLAYLHSMSIVHGDIKALNVLLDGNLNPLLCDFGLTRLLEWGYTASSSAFLNGSGSWRWLAPEMMAVNGTRRTRESDLYAFSMTIAEVLTGQVPFSGLNMFQLGCQVLNGHRPSTQPSNREGQDFGGLWKVAAACWDADPVKRPSADEVIRTLTSAKGGIRSQE